MPYGIKYVIIDDNVDLSKRNIYKEISSNFKMWVISEEEKNWVNHIGFGSQCYNFWCKVGEQDKGSIHSNKK